MDTIHTKESLSESQFPHFKIGRFTVRYPIVQGGMGVRVSTPQLAAAVTNSGGIGTLSSAGLPFTPVYNPSYRKRRHEEFQKLGRKLTPDESDKLFIEATVECIRLDIAKARKLIHNDGLLLMNIMYAGRGFTEMAQAACKAGIDGLVVGAGIPQDLPKITSEYPNVLLIPILSHPKSVRQIINIWGKKYNRIPDSIVLEDPSTAGGHLGAEGRQLENIYKNETKLSYSIPETKKILQEKGLDIPIIAAGGIVTHDDIRRYLDLGSSAVQMGTLFATSHESGFRRDIKETILHSKPEDIIEFYSPAGLPARALKSSPIFLKSGERREKIKLAEKTKQEKGNESGIEDTQINTKRCVHNCLVRCEFKDLQNNQHEFICLGNETLPSVLSGSKHPELGLTFVGTSAARVNEVVEGKILRVWEIMKKIVV